MITLGIDVGSVSVKCALLGDVQDKEVLTAIQSDCPSFITISNQPLSLNKGKILLLSKYKRTKCEPVAATQLLLNELSKYFSLIKGIRVSGSGNALIAELLGATQENDFRAVAKGVGALYPEVRTIFEMGGACSKYLRIGCNGDRDSVEILDYERNGECAAGTGSFIDQQATRLQYNIEEIGDVVLAADKAAIVAGRCSVFAKSDMIHAQQKGYQPPQVLKGLCEAVVRNFKGSIVTGKKIEPRVAFIGGVAANKGVVAAMKTLFRFSDSEFLVPPYHVSLSAIGLALLEAEAISPKRPQPLERLNEYVLHIGQEEFPCLSALSINQVTILRDRVVPFTFAGKKLPLDVYLGVDVGSVSTNLAVISEESELIKEIYTYTKSRPIEVVSDGLKEIEQEIGDKIRVRGAATTGSGRELIGKLIGADLIKDEITAHKTGANFIGKLLINRTPDTIFEVGGQDSKYISIQDNVVVDFTMNEACAAGTGSFLEEQAERMGVRIVGEFAALALRSTKPIRLGERCTVFMEKDILPFLQRGASKEDLTAGLAYSIAINYLNRVVRGRKIGETIFFQGGTAYNDSVAAAFATLLQKEIIVPPYNGVIGAIGAALLAREKILATRAQTMFRGFNLNKINYTLREFTCKACSNYCDMQEFKVEGERTFWGDKCSDQFRARKQDREAIIPDLLASRQQALLDGYIGDDGRGIKIGFPRSLYFYERFPFWNRFLSEAGFNIILSSATNREVIDAGIDAVVAEPCFPLKVIHGHVRDLLNKQVDYLLIPHVINAETEFPHVYSHVCPWGQTAPFVIKFAPLMEGKEDLLLTPMIHFQEGMEMVKREMRAFTKRFGLSKRKTDRAVELGYEAQNEFRRKLVQAGQEALQTVLANNAAAIVLVGRPYNIYDSGVNLDVPRKLRDYYGVNVIPMDFLPLDDIDIADVNPNMFWNYGRKIIQASKIVGRYSNLHILYITNFKCGPDSYIKHYVKEASGKPFLSLQFDGHSNDAGFMTRCEAYLDSKGFLRWWAKQ